MGEGRYRTLLCLVQLAIPEGQGRGERIMILDPLDDELDASPLTEVLADPAVRLVVHAGRQDVALLRRALRRRDRERVRHPGRRRLRRPRRTELLRLAADRPAGAALAKTASFTRWDTRPLSAEQVAYAREDVVHLLELAEVLEGRLRELGRLEWALEECEAWRTPATSATWRRSCGVCRAFRGSAPGHGVARELVAWRESVAERQDRPVQGVLSDATLVELARRSPASGGPRTDPGPRGRGRWPPRSGAAGGHPAGHRTPPDTVPRPPDRRPQARRPPAGGARRVTRCARAREAGLAYELLATRAELQAIVTATRERRGGRPHAPGLAARGRGPGAAALLAGDGRVGAERGRGTPLRGGEIALKPGRLLFDAVVDFEQRQVHRDHDEADDPAHDDDHDRLEDRRQGLDRRLPLFLVELGDPGEHRSRAPVSSPTPTIWVTIGGNTGRLGRRCGNVPPRFTEAITRVHRVFDDGVSGGVPVISSARSNGGPRRPERSASVTSGRPRPAGRSCRSSSALSARCDPSLDAPSGRLTRRKAITRTTVSEDQPPVAVTAFDMITEICVMFGSSPPNCLKTPTNTGTRNPTSATSRRPRTRSPSSGRSSPSGFGAACRVPLELIRDAPSDLEHATGLAGLCHRDEQRVEHPGFRADRLAQRRPASTSLRTSPTFL